MLSWPLLACARAPDAAPAALQEVDEPPAQDTSLYESRCVLLSDDMAARLATFAQSTLQAMMSEQLMHEQCAAHDAAEREALLEIGPDQRAAFQVLQRPGTALYTVSYNAVLFPRVSASVDAEEGTLTPVETVIRVENVTAASGHRLELQMLWVRPRAFLPSCVRETIENEADLAAEGDSQPGDAAEASAIEAQLDAPLPRLSHADVSQEARAAVQAYRQRQAAESSEVLVPIWTDAASSGCGESSAVGLLRQQLDTSGGADLAAPAAQHATQLHAEAPHTPQTGNVAKELRLGAAEWREVLRHEAEEARAANASSGLQLLELSDTPSHNPFEGTNCLKEYPMRDQGQCGSCYAFAAAAMFSLNYCRALAKAGRSTDAPFAFSTQGMVSCGSRMYDERWYRKYSGPPYRVRQKLKYNNGCGGASAMYVTGRQNGRRVTKPLGPPGTMNYLIDHGLTWMSCYPYACGGGDSHNHYNGGSRCDRNLPACKTRCKDGGAMRKEKARAAKGPFRGEQQVMQAIKTYGALYCGIAASPDLMGTIRKGSNRYRGGDKVETICGPSKTDHAVALYGWGAENGVKYWLGINSWDRFGFQPRGSPMGIHASAGHFKIRRGASQSGCRKVEDDCWTVTFDTPRGAGAAAEAPARGRGGAAADTKTAHLYSIRYDDGDTEENVAPSRTWKKGDNIGDVTTVQRVGDNVWVDYKGTGDWYRGKVTKVGAGSRPAGGGQFTIRYDDGETESNVAGERIRGRRRLGAAVSANWGGEGTWFPGKITATKFSVDYKDGSFESGVALSRIQGKYKTVLGAEASIEYQGSRYDGWLSSKTMKVRFNDGDEAWMSDDLLSVSVEKLQGKKVEVLYEYDGRYYPGVISAVTAAAAMDGRARVDLMVRNVSGLPLAG